MRGATLCSGIGAPECAMPEIDWIWSADIEDFPNAVRAVRFPDATNLGDMTADDFVARAAAIGLPDVLVAGTPCQAFSVAGLRRSLDDDRGNLTLRFVRICDAIDDLRRDAGLAPLWIVWENVPGVLSVKDNAFGALLAGLVGHDAAVEPPRGRGWTNAGVVSGPRRGAAWRVLDAQHFGVAQRRRRVFCVARGGAGDWGGADALLPLIDSLSWHPAPRREARKVVAGRSGGDAQDGGWPSDLSPTLNAAFGSKLGLENQHIDGGAGMFVPVAFHPTQDPISSENVCDALGTGSSEGCATAAVAFAIQERAVSENPAAGPQGKGFQEGIGYTLEARHHVQAVAHSAAVRRLTPRECERLQGFPDDWTAITYRNKPAADGPRYKALGNSMAVPVMRWILSRVMDVEATR